MLLIVNHSLRQLTSHSIPSLSPKPVSPEHLQIAHWRFFKSVKPKYSEIYQNKAIKHKFPKIPLFTSASGMELTKSCLLASTSSGVFFNSSSYYLFILLRASTLAHFQRSVVQLGPENQSRKLSHLCQGNRIANKVYSLQNLFLMSF